MLCCCCCFCLLRGFLGFGCYVAVVVFEGVLVFYFPRFFVCLFCLWDEEGLMVLHQF